MKRLPRLAEIPETMEPDAFWQLLGRIEHEQLDFKVKPNKDMTTEIAAMSMTDGGLLVLGISNKREIVGCPASQRTLDLITKAGHSCTVDLQAKEVRVGDVPVTFVAIHEVRGRIVTTPDGRLMRRFGSDSMPLVGETMARFVREREERPAEADIVPVLDLGELSLDLVNSALEGDNRPRATRRTLVRALIDLGVADVAEAPLDPKITKAAVLLFSKEPRRHVPAASVQVVRRVGVGPHPGPIQAREELSGPIPTVLEAVIDFLRRNTSRHEAVIGTHREEIPEYPASVLREAVLNALAHRDYGLAGATVDITVWDDRIEIRSPGPLPGHITLDNMREEHYSRNRRIMHVLKLMDEVEEYGEGIDRMYADMEARLLEPPVFAADSSVSVTLRNRSLIGVEDQAWLALLGHLELSAQERRVLVLARHERALTRRQLRTILGDADIDALLAAAVAKGLLVRVGQRGGAHYVLSDELVLRAGGAGLEARSRQRQMLLDEIKRRGSLSTNEAMELLQEPDRALVKHLLDDLVRAGEVVAKGRTRAHRYVLAA